MIKTQTPTIIPERTLLLKNIILYILANLRQHRSIYFIVKSAYIAHQRHLAEYYTPLFDDEIYAMDFGPVPSAIYDALKIARGQAGPLHLHENEGFENFQESIRVENESFYAAESPDLNLLSESALKCLDYAIDKVERMTFNEVVETTHQAEWNRAYRTGSKLMDEIEIAREGGIEADAIPYLEEQLELNLLLRQ